MTASQAATDVKNALDVISPLLPILAPIAPGPVGGAVAAVQVISIAADIASKIEADLNADVSQEKVNLDAAIASMQASVAKVNQDAA